MTIKSKNYYQAIAVLIGQIIGVGIFGLPFLIAKAGVLSLVFFIIFIGFVQYFIHLIYANLVIVTHDYHQLPGYTEKYLGKQAKHVVFLASLIGNYSALLAYIIVSGTFLFQLLSPTLGGNEFIYATAIFLLEAVIVFLGVRVLARVELIMSALLVFVVGLIVWYSSGAINFNNYIIVDWKYFLVPYGAMLFALDGSSVIPFIVQLLNKDKASVKSAIKIGTLIPAIITAVFALVIVGISGSATTPDALVGVKAIMYDGIITFALLFGILCIITSFLGSAQSLAKAFHFDYHLNKYLAWFFTVSIPFLLYAAGVKDLIGVISFAGAVAGGLISITLISIVCKNCREPQKNVLFANPLSPIILYFLISMFVVGIFYEVFCFILK